MMLEVIPALCAPEIKVTEFLFGSKSVMDLEKSFGGSKTVKGSWPTIIATGRTRPPVQNIAKIRAFILLESGVVECSSTKKRVGQFCDKAKFNIWCKFGAAMVAGYSQSFF